MRYFVSKKITAIDPWLIGHRPNHDARLRLFCFPYAGGGAQFFHTWSTRLPEWVEICPLQLPGRGSRSLERPFTRLGLLTQAIAQALQSYLDRPFALFGHSMGAIISFELARELRRLKIPQPVHLFVSGRNAPQLRNEKLLTYNLPIPEFLEELRRLNGTPQEVLENWELMEFMMPLLRADFELVQTYKYTPEAPLDFPITVFSGLQDREVSQEGLAAWQEQTSSRFTQRIMAGDHFFPQTSQNLFFSSLAEELDKVESNLVRKPTSESAPMVSPTA